MSFTPILLADHDGMRLLKKTQTTNGQLPIIVQHNPHLIGAVIAEKHLRASIKDANIRQFG